MKRPAKVPPGAEYSSAYKLWGIGKYDDQGREQGVWSWHSGSGKKVLEQTYVAGTLRAARTYYPDGTLKSTTRYKKDVANRQSFFLRPDGKWRDSLVDSLTISLDEIPEGVVEVRQVPDKYPLSYEFFDAKKKLVKPTKRKAK